MATTYGFLLCGKPRIVENLLIAIRIAIKMRILLFTLRSWTRIAGARHIALRRRKKTLNAIDHGMRDKQPPRSYRTDVLSPLVSTL